MARQRHPGPSFKDLPSGWKATVVALAAIVALNLVATASFSVFWEGYQRTNAEARQRLRKPDGELQGVRMEVPREGKAPVSVNLYLPADADGPARPLLVNVHGGGFVGGDADVLDTQSRRISDEAGFVVAAVDYTKADVEPIAYGAEEICDTVCYLVQNASSYGIDPSRVFVVGYSAGAYYAEESVERLQAGGLEPAGVVLCYPWTTGLSTGSLGAGHCPALFVLAGRDEISQRSKPYADAMSAAGVEVDVREYADAVHSFIESNNPEGRGAETGEGGSEKDGSDAEKGEGGSEKDVLSEVINPEQERLAREAERQIEGWVAAR